MEDNPVQPIPTPSVENTTQPISSVQQQNQTPPIPEKPSRLTTKMKIIIAIVIIFILLLITGIAGAYYLGYINPDKSTKNNSSANSLIASTSAGGNWYLDKNKLTQNTTPTVVDIKKVPGWKLFVNMDQGYAIQFPDNYITYCEDTGSCVIGTKGDSELGGSFGADEPSFSILPLDSYYQYYDPKYRKLFDDYDYNEFLEIKNIYDNLLTLEKFKLFSLDDENYINRAEDIKIGNLTFKVFLSSPDEYYDYRNMFYIITYNNKTYIIEREYEENSAKILDEIINTFTFINEDYDNKIISDLSKELGPNFSDTEIKYIYDNFSEGITNGPLFEDDTEFTELYRFYAHEENGKWKFIVNEANFEYIEPWLSDYEWCVEKVKKTINLPIEINCLFNDYYQDYSDIYDDYY